MKIKILPLLLLWIGGIPLGHSTAKPSPATLSTKTPTSVGSKTKRSETSLCGGAKRIRRNRTFACGGSKTKRSETSPCGGAKRIRRNRTFACSGAKNKKSGTSSAFGRSHTRDGGSILRGDLQRKRF